jgi:hypothetical protein
MILFTHELILYRVNVHPGLIGLRLVRLLDRRHLGNVQLVAVAAAAAAAEAAAEATLGIEITMPRPLVVMERHLGQEVDHMDLHLVVPRNMDQMDHMVELLNTLQHHHMDLQQEDIMVVAMGDTKVMVDIQVMNKATINQHHLRHLATLLGNNMLRHHLHHLLRNTEHLPHHLHHLSPHHLLLHQSQHLHRRLHRNKVLDDGSITFLVFPPAVVSMVYSLKIHI